MIKENKINNYRIQFKYSWRDLAEKMDLTVSTIHAIANRKVKDINVSTAKKIKKVTGLEPEDYL